MILHIDASTESRCGLVSHVWFLALVSCFRLAQGLLVIFGSYVEYE